MKAEILERYAKAIKENEKLEYNKEKEIDITRTSIRFDDSTLYVNFKDSYGNDLRSKFPKLEFTNEERMQMGNLVFDFISKKYKSNLAEAKNEYSKMLIEKL